MPWLDGALLPGSTVPFSLADRGLLLGDGVFDTSLVLGGKMVWRTAHVERLVASTKTLGFAVEPTQIEQAIDAVLDGTGHASMRVTVTRGVGPRGVAPPRDAKPTIFATTAPLRTELLFASVALHPTETRRNETSAASRLKSLSYIDSVLAAREAIEAGCDDALFFNLRGNVACTAIGNLFALFGDQLVTPPLDDGIVAGIARATLLRTCDELGLEAVERSLAPADLDQANAIVVTNSVRLLAPVTAIGRKQLDSSGSRRAQALVAHLAELIQAETGVDPRKIAES